MKRSGYFRKTFSDGDNTTVDDNEVKEKKEKDAEEEGGAAEGRVGGRESRRS